MEMLATKFVELAYVGLLAYVAKLVAQYGHVRLSILGKDGLIFRQRNHYAHEALDPTK